MTRSVEWDIVVIGGANTDYVVRGPRLPVAGETVEGEQFLEGPGGKGANQAVAAARLGARVALISKLGRDSRGDALVDRLCAAGVDTQFVLRDDRTATGVALIMVDEAGEKSILTAPGAIKQLTIDDLAAAAPALRSTRALLCPLEAPVETLTAAVRLARDAGARTVLDPAPAHQLNDALLRLIDLIRPNAAEAQGLTGIQVPDRDAARSAGTQLLQRGVAAAIVPAGERGDLLVTRDGEHWLARIPVATVDATGAGDAFAAACAVRLAEGATYAEAAVFANAAAALATTQWGAQAGLPNRDAVLALLKTAH